MAPNVQRPPVDQGERSTWPSPAKGGNPNLRLGLQPDGGFTCSAAISHLSEKAGHSTYIRLGRVQERDAYSEAPRVTGRLWVPRNYEALLWELAPRATIR